MHMAFRCHFSLSDIPGAVATAPSADPSLCLTAAARVRQVLVPLGSAAGRAGAVLVRPRAAILAAGRSLPLPIAGPPSAGG